MEKKFIMTAFGKDRPGIVADVTQLIYEHDCNLEDSTMTRLSDEFTMIFLFSGHGDDLEEQLSAACRRLEREKGLSAFFRPVESQPGKKKAFSTHTLHVEGIDHAGIVYHVSKYLAEQNINIANLSSQLRFSPESGTALYTIEMYIEIPEGTSMDHLEQGLSRVGDELYVDITFKQ
jgi:glycine cleavage system transcriptional repressor